MAKHGGVDTKFCNMRHVREDFGTADVADGRGDE